jgi:uncharacterized glyoxalase superfamily protein PhnB
MADPRVIPMLAYEDGAGAIDWLVKAFGFQERLRFTEDDGTISHAELTTDGGGLIMLATPTPDYVSPKRLRETSEEARKMAEVPYVIDGARGCGRRRRALRVGQGGRGDDPVRA